MHDSFSVYFGYLIAAVLSGIIFINVGIYIGRERCENEIGKLELKIEKLEHSLDEYLIYNQHYNTDNIKYGDSTRMYIQEANAGCFLLQQFQR